MFFIPALAKVVSELDYPPVDISKRNHCSCLDDCFPISSSYTTTKTG